MKLTQQLAQINGGFNFKENIQEPTVKFYEDHKAACHYTAIGVASVIALFGGYKAFGPAKTFVTSFFKKQDVVQAAIDTANETVGGGNNNG
ncbi:MAG: hypothetical protein FJ161_01210 [Gammaproteobacteria bacterium]|nr:hypothetical protein [Gammaproteobacteria bacterium]